VAIQIQKAHDKNANLNELVIKLGALLHTKSGMLDLPYLSGIILQNISME
jgi:hypothetical protein